MARTHERCPRDERLRASVPHGHWKTTTFVAGLRLSGIRSNDGVGLRGATDSRVI
jgi:hypothetical protein